MLSPLEDVGENTRQTETKPSKNSRIPSKTRSKSRTGGSGHRPFSVSVTGSPLSIALRPQRGIMSPIVGSKIPQTFHTPSIALVPRNVKLKSSDNGAHRSSLPVTRQDRETPSCISPPPLNINSLSSLNKPLPCPPIAQLVDPNSPPKAQRTLVDAEAGSPSVEEWPILRPENSPTLQSSLNTNHTVAQRQHRVSEASPPKHDANVLVENRKTACSRVAILHIEPSAPHDEKLLQMMELRRFSSNNPYAKNFHAISPIADVAINSPLNHKASMQMAAPVPPRVSSKRNSLPLLDHDQVGTTELTMCMPTHKIEPTSTKRPLLECQRGDTATNESVDSSPERSSIITVSEKGRVETGDRLEVEEGVTELPIDDYASQIQNKFVHSESSSSMTTRPPVNGGWVGDPTTGWWTKTLACRPSLPAKGSVLRIHQDAQAILFGDGEDLPKECCLPAQSPAKVSLDRSFDALARDVSKQRISIVTSSIDPSAHTPTPIRLDTNLAAPVVISPIRAMKPPRQFSTELPPRSVSSPTQSLSQPRATSEKCAQFRVRGRVVTEIISSKSIANSPLAPKDAFSNLASPIQPAVYSQEEEFAQRTYTKKAEGVPGVCEVIPSRPNWMASTVSSLKGRFNASPPRKSSRCMSSQGFISNISALSTTSASPRPATRSNSTANYRLAKLRGSLNTTPASERTVVSRSIQTDFSDVGQSFSSSPMTSATTRQPRREVKRSSALKIKAKQSFRNLFHKSDTISTKSLTKPTEPKRLSIATSGQTLAKRFSKNFSKVHLPKTPTDSKSEAQTLHTFVGRKSALASLEGATSSTVSKPCIAQRVNTATVINNIVNQIPTMPANSPDRLRTCELAEAVLCMAENANASRISVEKARKHARDAELCAEKSRLALLHMLKLCESLFDKETAESIRAIASSISQNDVTGATFEK